MIAVSLNVGGGVRLIKPAKLCMCTQNTTRTHGAGCVRQGFCTADVVTRIGIHIFSLSVAREFLKKMARVNDQQKSLVLEQLSFAALIRVS